MLQESALAPREPELTENAVSSPSPSMLRLILRERSFHRINAQPATTYRGGAAATNRNFTILRSWVLYGCCGDPFVVLGNQPLARDVF